MKKIFLFAFAALALASCKKYDCVCETDYYDYNGYYLYTTTETHTVKERTALRAELECASDGGGDTYCSIY